MAALEKSKYRELSQRVVDLLAKLARLGAKHSLKDIDYPTIGTTIHHACSTVASQCLMLM